MAPDDPQRPGRFNGRTGVAISVISLAAAALLWMNPAADLAAAGLGAQRAAPAVPAAAIDPAKVPFKAPATSAPARCP